jgi:2-polyprenyl-3-methyl-5-hydroxy-6-metoxy-1,4-benzoquinol methylase
MLSIESFSFIYFIVCLADNRVDLITCFVTLHHVPQLDMMLAEIIRILRPGGYLILREHDCKTARSLKAKYLNFVHAFMMIAGVGEFSNVSIHHIRKTQGKSDQESGCATVDWEQQKSDIIKYTNSIQYRTREEWQHELEQVGLRLRAELDYDGNNPQALYYAVYQLNAK